MTKRLAVCFIALIAGFATPTSAQEKQGHNVWRCLMQIVPPLRRSVLSMLQIRSDALFSLQLVCKPVTWLRSADWVPRYER
jgi:hypothetical protein